MPSLSVFGAQWGDEGKGKVIDRLAASSDYVVRYQGGSNAGHTVVVGQETYALHTVPSGILHRGSVNVVGCGVAVDPLGLLAEIDALRARGVEVSGANLRLSAGAHVILEHHRQLDRLSERWLGAGRLGTTGRGIGPCYADKAARIGLRVCDLLDPDRCRARLAAALAEKNAQLREIHGAPELDLEHELAACLGAGERLREHVGDTGYEVRRAYEAGRRILFEGAQGVMLDLDHGTYPFVTSSSTGPNGIASGVGFPPRRVDRVLGIAKAYCTRVGSGPFPSEDTGPLGRRLGERGREFGTTTGRARRCGWFDAPAVRFALELAGADGWVMTKLDVLSELAEIPVVRAYRLDGARLERYPSELADLALVEPELERLPGWRQPIDRVRRWEDLPAAARAYVEWLEERVGSPVRMVSVGPERDQVVPRGLDW
jgi:adenylosuccinate synthase